MTKPTIVTRTGKGSPLSIAEGDSNFTNLRDATFSVLANGVTVSNELNSSFEIEAGTGITVAGNNTSKKITITNSKLLSSEGSPALGGDLAVDGFKIVTSSNNRNIELDPHGTGVVAVTGPMTISGNLTVNGTTTTVNSTTVDIADKNITLAKGAVNAAAANGAGFTIEGPATPATMEYVSATDRLLFNKQIAGSFFSNDASNFSGGTVNLGSNANVTITGGSSGQVLRTDGAGALTWVNQSSGPSSTTDLTEGTNLYFTDARARSAVSATGSLGYNSSTGVFSYTTPTTDGISEGSTNFYFTNTRARAAVSGTGSISYNSSTGVFSLNGQVLPSQTGESGKYLTTDGTNAQWAPVVGSFVGTATSDLNMATFKIKTMSNQNLAIETASGTYGIDFKSNTNKFGYLDSNVTLTTNGAAQLQLNTNGGTNSGSIIINQGANANIGINPEGTGKIMLNGAVGLTATTGTPSTFNTSYFEGTLDTPAAWFKVSVGASTYYLPMFQ